MANVSATSRCDCPSDCESTFYSYSMSSRKVEPDAICNHARDVYGSYWYSDYPLLMRNFETMVSGAQMGNQDLCKKAMESIAFVHFQLSGEIIMQFKKELRVTLADQIANLGKYKVS